jgi:hypothetical protein
LIILILCEARDGEDDMIEGISVLERMELLFVNTVNCVIGISEGGNILKLWPKACLFA